MSDLFEELAFILNENPAPNLVEPTLLSPYGTLLSYDINDPDDESIRTDFKDYMIGTLNWHNAGPQSTLYKHSADFTNTRNHPVMGDINKAAHHVKDAKGLNSVVITFAFNTSTSIYNASVTYK